MELLKTTEGVSAEELKRIALDNIDEIIRIIHEEKFLEKELNGYKEYKKKVKYRIIPFIW